MKDIREVSVILGIKVIRKCHSIILSEEQYVEKTLRKIGYVDVNPVSIPYDAIT